MRRGTNDCWGAEYADKVVTYSRSRLKASIVKIDTMFLLCFGFSRKKSRQQGVGRKD
jgi:hypothetical protein